MTKEKIKKGDENKDMVRNIGATASKQGVKQGGAEGGRKIRSFVGQKRRQETESRKRAGKKTKPNRWGMGGRGRGGSGINPGQPRHIRNYAEVDFALSSVEAGDSDI